MFARLNKLFAPRATPPAMPRASAGSSPAESGDRLTIDVEGDERAGRLAAHVAAAFREALRLDTKLDPAILDLEGMSGRKYRMLINNLVRAVPDPRYLEVGCWRGSTSCAAMNGNRVRVLCVDNWTEFDGPREEFFANVARFRTDGVDFAFIESDFRAVEFVALGRFNIYLYDGPHGHQDQYDGLALALPALDDEFVLIVDDWNAPWVRVGTEQAVAALDLSRLYAITIRTTQTDQHAATARQHSDWHNGYHIAVYRKREAA